MSQEGFSSKGLEVESLKTISMPFYAVSMPSCAANMPACSVSYGACFGLALPLDGLPYSDCSGALSLHPHMPSVRASCSGNPGLPEPFHSNGGAGILSLLHAMLSAQGSNALGIVVVAFSAPTASLTLVVLLVGAGAVFASNDTPFGSIPTMAMHSTASAPTFPAMWTFIHKGEPYPYDLDWPPPHA